MLLIILTIGLTYFVYCWQVKDETEEVIYMDSIKESEEEVKTW